jgi:poly(A) polymerase
LRFIGIAEDRIREDYMRILRFFRFHAWYADPDGGLEAEGLAACAALADGIDRLSKERIGAEMRKLLAAPDPAPAVAAMAQAGVLAHALPGADARLLPVLVAFEGSVAPHPIRRLAALGGAAPEAALRLSKADTRRLGLLRDGMSSAVAAAELGYRHGVDTARDILLLRAALFEHPVDPHALTAAETGAQAQFPVKAADLMPRFTGPALGETLTTLEQRWIASEFSLSRAALLDSLDSPSS